MSDQDLFQVHLNATRLCQRGVRFRLLSASEQRKIEMDAVAGAGKESNPLAMRNEIVRRGVMSMLVSVTDPTPDMMTAKWTTVTLQDIMMPTSALYFDKLFPSPRDEQALSILYSDYHELKQSELEDIRGKIMPVTLG